MKHQYFGDVNDYVKYGILRCMAAGGLRVGVCWMMTPDDGRSDGEKKFYFAQPGKWAGHDGELFAVLQTAAGQQEERPLEAFEQKGLIPCARFYGAYVPDAADTRWVWFQQTLVGLGETEMVFFDPDNGIEVPSKPAGCKGSSKYVLWTEIERTWWAGKSLLIFQHFPRINRELYICSLVEQTQKRLAADNIVALRSANVLFLLVIKAEHAERMKTALGLLEKKWSPRVTQHSFGG